MHNGGKTGSKKVGVVLKSGGWFEKTRIYPEIAQISPIFCKNRKKGDLRNLRMPGSQNPQIRGFADLRIRKIRKSGDLRICGFADEEGEGMI